MLVSARRGVCKVESRNTEEELQNAAKLDSPVPSRNVIGTHSLSPDPGFLSCVFHVSRAKDGTFLVLPVPLSLCCWISWKEILSLSLTPGAKKL